MPGGRLARQLPVKERHEGSSPSPAAMKQLKLYPDANLPYPYSADLVKTEKITENFDMVRFGNLTELSFEKNLWSDGITRVTLAISSDKMGMNIVLVEYEEDENV